MAAAIGALLPDGGLYRGAVIEIASQRGLAKATSLALAACAAAQNEATLSQGHGYCAWIDASGSLYAPAVDRAGVDRQRLLVVRPFTGGTSDAAQLLSRVAVRVIASHAFSLVVVDAMSQPGSLTHAPNATAVRRLALAAEHSDTSVLLLTDLWAPRVQALPVSMRIEIERPADDKLWVRVAKDRYGRVTAKTPVPLAAPRGVRSGERWGSGTASRPSAPSPAERWGSGTASRPSAPSPAERWGSGTASRPSAPCPAAQGPGSPRLAG